MAWAGFVDVVLDDGGPDHGGGASGETPGDFLERAEVDADAAEEGVDLCSESEGTGIKWKNGKCLRKGHK